MASVDQGASELGASFTALLPSTGAQETSPSGYVAVTNRNVTSGLQNTVDIDKGTSSAPASFSAFTARLSVTAVPVYKNVGWYAAGSTWETWTSTGAPSTSPPSGHTLNPLYHVQINGPT